MKKTKVILTPGILTAIIALIIISFSAIKSSATVIPSTEYTTPAGYNDNDYQKLVTFALQGDNLKKLQWDLNKPESWNSGTYLTVDDDVYIHGITWVSSISGEKRVKYIVIHGQMLSEALTGDIDISDFTSLSVLLLSYNELTDINAANCVALKTLDCINNQLLSINLSDCKTLKDLNCGYNQLQSLNLSECTSLKNLNCYSNDFRDFDVLNCPSLELIDCRQQKQLKTLNVSGCESLEVLICEFNALEKINLKGCKFLRNLDCQFNNLKSIDLSDNINLNMVLLNENALTNISGISKLKNICYLSVSNNYLDLNNDNVFNSIKKIDATIKKNKKNPPDGYPLYIDGVHYDFIYEPQYIVTPAKPVISVSVSGEYPVITWKRAENASSYIIYRLKKGTTKYVKIAETEELIYTDNAIASSELHKYMVIAKNTNGNKSEKSLPKSTISKVENLTATVTGNSVKLIWDKAKNAQSYIVERSKGNGEYVLFKTVTVTNFTINNLKTGIIYKYRIRAIATEGENEFYSIYSDNVVVETE